MKLSAEQNARIVALVEQHCKANEVVPLGYTLRVTVLLEPAPLVIVEDQSGNSILDQPAAESFLAYWNEKKPKGRQGTHVKVFAKLNPNRRKPATIKDVILFRGHVRLSDPLDHHWLRIRDFGNKGLKMVDEWLASMDLKRGMKLPKTKK